MLLEIISLWSALHISNVVSFNLDTLNPLIYKLPKSGERSSYFGMTVTIRPGASRFKDSWVIQIGAPRANVSDLPVKEPGSVYRCQMYGPCVQFVADAVGNMPGVNYNHYYRDRKDQAWTGVSMDIKSSGNDMKTVVCGGRWANQNLTNDERLRLTYLMTGVCYLQDLCFCPKEYPVRKLLPLVNADKIYSPKPFSYDKSHYYWGLGQAGMSVALLDDLSALIIGAPGYSNWLGSVIYYSTDVMRYPDFRVALFEDMKGNKDNFYPYIGYEVAFGRFFNDKKIWLLAGAPRSDNYHGKVIVFQFKEFTSSIDVVSELEGSTFGEYFGSAMAVSDINNDGFDDVVIGAPLFSGKQPEEGRIYVYLGTNRGKFLFRSQVINGRMGHSRFGSCISSVGDLDQDGYRDIAVGAPYEQNGRGAIYIYRGSAKGIEMEHSQLIAAQEVYAGLRGFGISISRGVDVDGNKHNDVAVGAYLSDEVVLLRSRPIVHLHLLIVLEDISLLDRKATSFNISACSRYSGSNGALYVRFTRTIEVDIGHNRAFFTRDGKSVQKDDVRLMADKMNCEILTLTLKNDTSNYKPLLITLRSELPSCHSNPSGPLLVWDSDTEMKDKFLKWCPIGRKKEVTIDVPFAGECGADNICQAELALNCKNEKTRSNAHVIVNSEIMTLSLDLRNTGEPAHRTYITIQSNLYLIGYDYVDGMYLEVTEKTFHIDVGSTFLKSYHTDFSFRIATDMLQVNRTIDSEPTYLNLKIESHTSSAEDFLGDNSCDLNFVLSSDCEVNLFPSATATGVFDRKNSTQLNFTLFYEVQKRGDTPVSDAELNIYVPSYIDDYGEIEFSTVTVETSDRMYSSINYEEKNKWRGPSEVDVNWYKFNSSDHSLPPARTLFLNCTDPAVRCKVITVVFQDGIQSPSSSHVKILVTLNLTSIAPILGEKNIIHFTSACALEYKSVFQFEPIQTVSQSSVTFYKGEETKAVEPYVIALSVVAGGLLLVLITAALVRSDFFRRKKKEQLQALKTEELRRRSNYEFPPEIVEEDCGSGVEPQE